MKLDFSTHYANTENHEFQIQLGLASIKLNSIFRFMPPINLRTILCVYVPYKPPSRLNLDSMQKLNEPYWNFLTVSIEAFFFAKAADSC